MNDLFRLLVLSLLSTTCVVRADDVGPYYDADQDGEDYEMNHGYYPYQSYQSTDYISPAFRKMVDQPQCYDDLYTFFTPRGYSISEPGAMIVDNEGELIWVKYTDGQAYDLVMHEFKGKQYLTYWIGDDRIRGHGQGDYYMLNSSYQQVAKISAIGEDLKADLHEMVITPEGTALITIYQVYQYDLEGWEPGESYIWDCLFQEIDITKNELLFQWRASDHHAIDETFRGIDMDGPEDSPWDWYHMNSIQKDGLGNYLVSARYTHTITYINGTTGDIIWILGGKRNSFKDLSDGRATAFAWQHDARMVPLNTFPELMIDDIRANGFWEGEITVGDRTTQLVSMFDNSADDRHYADGVSRGLLLEVSYPAVGPPVGNFFDSEGSGELTERWDEPSPNPEDPAYTVRLVKSYDHPQGIISSSQGSFQVLPSDIKGKDPKVLVGYGFNAVWTEYAANGEVICDTHFATKYSWERGDVQSYRVFKFPWVGHPTDPPSAALGDESVFVSWNGATEVKTWVLQHSNDFESDSQEAWTDITQVQKQGFETEIQFDEDVAHRYLRVLALDVNGKILGISRDIDLGWTAGLTAVVPKMVDGNLTPLKMLMLFACNITALVLLYEGCKKYFAWRRHRQSKQVRSVRLGSEV